MGEAKRRKQLDKGFGTQSKQKPLMLAKSLKIFPKTNEHIKLALKTIRQTDVLDYVGWSMRVQGCDYEHEQIDPEVNDFFVKNKLPSAFFYPYAWGKFNAYFVDEYKDGWEVAKGLLFIESGIGFDYERYYDGSYDDDDSPTEKIDGSDFHLAWINEAMNYLSVGNPVVDKEAQKRYAMSAFQKIALAIIQDNPQGGLLDEVTVVAEFIKAS